jgi:hypothetical protein
MPIALGDTGVGVVNVGQFEALASRNDGPRQSHGNSACVI